MSASKVRRPALLVVGVVILLTVVIAVLKRDAIADLLLRGGDVSLTDDVARKSPQAKLAVDFVGALRAMDSSAIAKLATPEQIARIQQETKQPSQEFQEMRAMMLDDLPADPTALQNKIKSVQVHRDRSVVSFETKANTWFVQFAMVDGTWKVSGF